MTSLTTCAALFIKLRDGQVVGGLERISTVLIFTVRADPKTKLDQQPQRTQDRNDGDQ